MAVRSRPETDMTKTVFVLEPDPEGRTWIASALAPLAESVVFLDAPPTVFALLGREGDCLVACAEPDEEAVLELVRELRLRGSRLPAIVFGPHTAFRTAVEIARLEATDFLEHPFSERQLRAAVRNACKAVP